MVWSPNKKNNRGFLVLTMVLLVSAVVLAVGAGIMLRSIGEVTETSDSEMALKAWSTVNACGEIAVLELSTTTNSREGWSYGGDVEIDVGNDNNPCYIYPIETSGSAKIIKASSTVSDFTRKLLIEVATNTPSVIINSWELVADFE
ncbi:MAG: hypothetical protein WC027_01375 [Candidatus Paceibacterota bacterium]